MKIVDKVEYMNECNIGVTDDAQKKKYRHKELGYRLKGLDN